MDARTNNRAPPGGSGAVRWPRPVCTRTGANASGHAGVSPPSPGPPAPRSGRVQPRSRRPRCGRGQLEPAGAGGGATGAAWDGNDLLAYRPAAAFTEREPNVKVEIELPQGGGDHYAKIKTLLGGGTPSRT